jgi:hypothetical protein
MRSDSPASAFYLIFGSLLFRYLGTLYSQQAEQVVEYVRVEKKDKKWRFAQVYRPAVKGGFLKKAQAPERLGNLKFLAGPAEYRFPS